MSQAAATAWNPSAGGGSNYYFYRKGADVVVTKANGEFVTILKGGVQNSWYQGQLRCECAVSVDAAIELCGAGD